MSDQDENSDSLSDDSFDIYSGVAKRFKKEKEKVGKTGKVNLVDDGLAAKSSHSLASKTSSKYATYEVDSSDEELFKENDSTVKEDDLDESKVVNYNNEVERFEDIEEYINVSPDIPVNRAERRTHSAASVVEEEVELEEEDPLYCAPLNDSELNQSLNDEVVVVKVRFIGQKVWRIELKRTDYFKQIIKELSTKAGVDAEKISLYFNDQKLDNYGTLKTVPIRITDIIDAVVCSEGAVAATSENMLEFKVRSQNRNSQVVISIRPEDPMKILMVKYADATNNDLAKLSFNFDGDRLEEDDTPSSLDLEGGECIDVHIKE